MVLKCDICGKPIRGMTGLQELQNMRKHLARAHRTPLDMHAALERRVVMEDKQEGKK